MADDVRRKVTYVPFLKNCAEGYSENKERKLATVYESLYWQTIGWVHTPPFIKTKFDPDIRFKIPRSSIGSEKYKYFTKKSFEPKLQIEDRVPYGALPKSVASDIEKRRFAKQDLKTILDEMGIKKEVILPSILFYKDDVEVLGKDNSEGIPSQPFLNLDTFDDAWYYDAYSGEKWLALGDTESGRKPLPGVAFIPKQRNCTSACLDFDWHKVSVLDYDTEKKLFLVSRDVEDRDSSDDESLLSAWIPRIYLKFDAEEPLQFAKRLHTAVYTRHVVEESLRMNYYVECMPLENCPEWPKEDLDSIIEIARRSRSLQPKLQWIKDHIASIVDELQLEYKRAYNYRTYMEIAKETPCSIKDFKNETLIFQKASLNLSSELNVPFAENFESFRCKTFCTCIEAFRALNTIEENIVKLRNMSLYNLPLTEILTLEKFEALQKAELQNISAYIRETWTSEISRAILVNLEHCGKGPYDLNQTILHTFKLTKLGRLLRMVNFKMQDVIRFLIIDSLKEYALIFQTACSTVMDVKDNYTWSGSLSDDQFSPPGKPIFEVPLEIKGDRLQFVISLEKYDETIKDLFEEGLLVTKDLPKIEKHVMKKMLYNPDDKLDTVGEKEKHVVRWKMDINRGINRAMVVATAYIRAYDIPLKSLKIDQINYVKQLARKKASCDHLKAVIEMHNSEKTKLENTIPSFIDIGPFRLMTKSVRQAAIKKHEQLADAVLSYLYTKLKQCMEEINNEFLMLIDRIEQPTGNIEDLMDKKQWCRTVPKKIEKICIQVNQLRSDVRLMSTFNRNMEDADFSTYWLVQKLPQDTMQKLRHRISTFDVERSQHRQHLHSDQEKLKSNLRKLQSTISNFIQYSDLKKAPTIAAEVRKARKSLTTYEEQAQLYQRRERLFGLPISNYPEIAQLSTALIPFEKFWLSAAEFATCKERDDADLQAIQDFHSNLEESLELFPVNKYPEIHQSVITALKDVENFIATRLS